jgi:L-malate glycosyltransferase
MSGLRLMHVFPSFNPGGAELRMARIMNGLGARANHAVLALNGMVGARQHIDRSVAVHFIEPPPQSRQLAYVTALRRIIAAEAPDLLLTYNWGSMEAVMASWVSGLPLVHNECGFGADEATRLKLRRVLARRVLLRRAYGVAVTANVMRETVMRRFGVPSRKVFWIRTGVDVERFQPGDGHAWRDSAGIRNTDIVFGFVGTLRPEKNLGFLVQAFSRAAIPDAKLVLAGEGPCRAELEALIQRLGLSGSVLLSGHAAEPEVLLRALDVFVISSTTEATPNSLLEAMACGLPTVCTDVGDIREMLGTEAENSLTQSGDLSAFAAALVDQALSGEKRRRAGEANRRRVVERHSVANMIAGYEALYRAAAEGTRLDANE